MEHVRIDRRRFLRFALTLGAGATLACWQWLRRRSETGEFYVAGVRFHRVGIPPQLNEKVIIQSGEWRGLPCYSVLTERGERIGYVPRHAVSELAENADCVWRVCGLNQHAVPWKRYRISISA